MYRIAIKNYPIFQAIEQHISVNQSFYFFRTFNTDVSDIIKETKALNN